MLTESAAITLYLADTTGRDDLVPPPDAPERARFLRWLVFIVANIYPVYTYRDDPSRFVSMAAAALVGPCFFGDRFSALDIYICVMTRWTPQRNWHQRHCPRLFAIAEAVEARAYLSSVWDRNFAS